MIILPLNIRYFSRSLMTFAVLACLLPGSVSALPPGKTGGWAIEELSSRLSNGKLAEIVNEFGDGSEAALIVREAKFRHIHGQFLEGDREEIDMAAARLSNVPTSRSTALEKAQLGRAWKRMAVFLRDLDGPSETVLNYLEIAYSLNPSDEGLAKEVKFQRSRKEIVQARADEAARIREARSRGEDPDSNHPYRGVNYNN